MTLNRLVLGSALVIMMTILIAIPFYKISDAGSSKSIEMVPNVVVIKFKDDPHVENNKIHTGNIVLNDLLAKNAVTSLQPVIKNNRFTKSNSNIYDLSNIYYATYSGGQSPAEVAANLEVSPIIEYAEPKYIYYITVIPNDSLYHHQEAYYNIIKATQAWDIVKGENSHVIIAIVGGGTDIRHPDLADNIWSNDAEVNGTEGVDDDDNGYKDDLYGWNFANNSGDPTGLESTPLNADHGTFTAGIVSAVSDNITGVSGVSWNATVMAINVSSESKDGVIDHGYDGIIYAAGNGADVISCSWGAYTFYTHFGQNVMRYANSMGAVVVASAGNDNTPDLFYPAAYENVLSVAGTDTNDIKWESSNYGPHIDLAAPAVSIYSTWADGRYGVASGTSLSAPLVAGVAGLVKAQNPDWTGVQAGEQVRVTADSIPGYAGELGRGRLNVYRAVTESSPSIHFVGYDYIDENNNRFIERGERIEVYITLINYLAIANNIKITLSTSSDYLTMIDDEASLSSLGTLEEITLSDPFVFDVAENTPDNPLIEFDLQIEADGYSNQNRFTFEQVFTQINWKKDVNPVLNPGESGEWDSQFVFSPSVLFDSATSVFKMWYCGGNGEFTGSIGYATSLDGINWTKYENNPVMVPGASGEWDDGLIGMHCVLFIDDTYHIWYSAGTDQSKLQIGYATSPNGITWTKYHENPVLKTGLAGSWEETWVLFPCVIFDGSIFKMWYIGAEGNPITNENWEERIGYATSPDGVDWKKWDKNPVLDKGLAGKWDDFIICSFFVLFDDNIYKMWYTGGDGLYLNIGEARSPDGVKWTRNPENPVLSVAPTGNWDWPRVQDPRIVIIDNTYHMWFSGGGFFTWSIGYATGSDVLSGSNDNIPVDIPRYYVLSQNYPNPFNPKTMINYQLSMTIFVDLSIYNILGQKVITLVTKRQPAGKHQVEWDASGFASGLYYYQLKTGEFQDVKKMILLK